MKQTIRTIIATVVATLYYLYASAAVVPGGAVLKGRIVDVNDEILPGAVIQVQGMEGGVVSDINGYYTFTDLLPGSYTVKVSYVGYEPTEMVIRLTENKTTVMDFVLEGVEALDGTVIFGALSGQRKAFSMQKNSMGISNVISQDQISKFPDSNIGDALKRINGINVQYDQGEARFGQVRGTSPDLSSVTINGNRLPSAEAEVRNVQLDLIPSDMIQTIEVNKVVTSDMDADAIGGSINLVTKNSPYSRVLNMTAGSGWNWVSDKPQMNLGMTYGDRFFKGRLGVMASASYQNSPSGSDNTEFSYLVKGDEVKIDDIQIRQYYVTRERQSYSLSLDYDINPDNRIYLKGIYNRRNDWENRYRLTFKGLSDGDGKMSARIQTKGGSVDNRGARLELQQTMDYTLGGEHQLGNLKMDWDLSYARATEDRPEERYFDMQLKKQSFDIHDAFGRQPYSGTMVDLTDGGKWGIKEITNSNKSVAENDVKAKIDFSLPLSHGKFGNKLKFGAKYSSKQKEKHTAAYDYTSWYEDNYGKEYMDNLTLQVRDGFMPGDMYQKAHFVSKDYLASLRFDPSYGEFIMEDSSADYDASESVTAAYVRLDQKLGKKMELMAGLRMERTGLKYAGMVWDVDEDTEDETLTPTGKSGHSYINWLPSLLWKWNVSDSWKVRASFTETLARPKYSYLVPSVGIDTKSGSRTEITIGNPALKPAVSYNVDLATEKYLTGLGVVSAGLFFKRINNFIVNEITYGDYRSFSDCEFTMPVNGFDGNLMGVELGLSTDFGFITPALDCLGFDGNYTYTHTDVVKTYVSGSDEHVLPGSPKHMLNSSLFLVLKGFNARLSYNFTDSFQDDEEYQSDARLRRYYDACRYLDLNLGYTFGKKMKTTVYVDMNNLLNQPLRYYIGGNRDITTQVEYYGQKISFGLKVSL